MYLHNRNWWSFPKSSSYLLPEISFCPFPWWNAIMSRWGASSHRPTGGRGSFRYSRLTRPHHALSAVPRGVFFVCVCVFFLLKTPTDNANVSVVDPQMTINVLSNEGDKIVVYWYWENRWRGGIRLAIFKYTIAFQLWTI